MKISNLLKIIMLTILSTVSCSKDGGEAVSVSLSPSALNAPHSLSNQSMEVQSNGEWTIRILSADGLDVTWAKSNREEGSGNAKVTIRVFQNEYRDSRSAKVTVTSATGETASIDLIQEGNPDVTTGLSELTFRIGTYNL